MTPPALKPLCRIEATLGAPIEKGALPGGGMMRIIPITGGTVEGERLSGRILDLGADWQTVDANGKATLDTRYGIETHDGAIIDVRNFGFRHGPPEVIARLAAGEPVDPSLYYMRTHPRFETGDPRYAWLNHTILLGTGARQASSVRIEIFEVL